MPIFRVTATQDMPWFAMIEAEDEEQAWSIARGDVGPDPQWEKEKNSHGAWEEIDFTLEDITREK